MNKRFLEGLWLRRPEGESGAADGQEVQAQEEPEQPVEGQEAEGEAQEAPSPHVQQQSGLVARVGQLTRQKRELEERLAALEAQRTAPPSGEAPEGLDPETARRTIDLEINRRASLIAQREAWAQTADRVWNEGLSKHGDWAPQLNALGMMFGDGVPRGLTEAAIETGAPVDVLYHLAQNPEQALNIAGLSPAKQGVALAKIANELSAKSKGRGVSNAPSPVTPRVNGGGASAPAKNLDDPNLSMEEWARLRNEQVRAKRGRR
jgi:hypothetical protein